MTNVVTADNPDLISLNELSRGDTFSYYADRYVVYMVVYVHDAIRFVNLAEGTIHTCKDASAHVFLVRRALIEKE